MTRRTSPRRCSRRVTRSSSAGIARSALCSTRRDRERGSYPMTTATQVQAIEPPHTEPRRGRAVLNVLPGVAWLLLFFVCPFLVMVVMSFGTSDYTGIVLDWTLR